MAVERQSGSDDCGLFALTFAVTLLTGFDSVNVVYDQPRMREHLIQCLEASHFEQFPTKCQRTVRRSTVRCLPLPLYCVCRLGLIDNF